MRSRFCRRKISSESDKVRVEGCRAELRAGDDDPYRSIEFEVAEQLEAKSRFLVNEQSTTHLVTISLIG